MRRAIFALVLAGLTLTLIQPTATAAERQKRWAPPEGVVLSDPMVAAGNRAIAQRVNRAIRGTAKGEYVRVAVWNFDDRATARSLVDAHRRGVHVQIVVASPVENPNWTWIRRVLNRNDHDRSFAVRCHGACRSAGKIMHSKFVLISRVHRVHNVSMVGSFNLTRAAGSRQWNDMVTAHSRWLYQVLRGTFREYAADRPVGSPFEVRTFGRHKVTLWPSFRRNTIRDELRHVSCRVPSSHGFRRTKIRIAIAGWFDAFGYDVASQIRRLWNRGCNIRIITTLAGGGVNRTLRSTAGRGPVPIRQVSVDRDLDGVPERYLHMKAVAIRGGFAGDPSANVLFTGSPNWSSRASRSDEIVFRFLSARRMVGRYLAHIDRLFSGPWSQLRTAAPPALVRRAAGGDPSLPEWFELD